LHTGRRRQNMAILKGKAGSGFAFAFFY